MFYTYLMREMQNDISEHERVRALENSTLDLDDKLTTALLLFTRKKQGALFGRGIGVGNSTPKPKDIEKMRAECGAIVRLLKQLKVPHTVERAPAIRNGILNYRVVAAKNKTVLAELTTLIGSEETVENATRMGALMGYPKTATEAYRTDNALDLETDLSPKERDALREEHLRPFVLFKPSRTHWNTEAETVRTWKKTVQQKCPKLFADIISANQKS